MAYTERYVTVAGAGAHDGTSEANAWTLAEMITADPYDGTRVNIKAGSYSSGATSFLAGSAAIANVYRGYNSTIGDLDNQGRNSDGTLNTTNFPVITTTGTMQAGGSNIFQNLSITGAVSSHLLGNSTGDNWAVVNCSITNTQNNASARCLQGDNTIQLVNSDFYCSGAAHASVVDVDFNVVVVGCRFRSTSSSACLTIDNGYIVRSLFYGNSSSVGIVDQGSTTPGLFLGNTFYGIGTPITFPNSAPTTFRAVLINNHATDNSKWLDNLYSATGTVQVIEGNNRLRDNTTPRTGIETVTFSEVTTDTGGAETDYTNAASGNFILISAAPGKAVGMPANTDIGAYQHTDSGGGGGGIRLAGRGIGLVSMGR